MEPENAPLGLSRWDTLAPLALVGLLAAWVLLAPTLPLRVPTHFDLAGNANGWTGRQALPWLIFGLPVGNWVLLWLVDLAMQGSDQEAQRAATRPIRGLMTLGMAGIGLSILLIPLHGLWLLWPALGFLFLCLGLGIRIAWRGRKPLPREEEACWKWGMIYVNPQDERIWLPKRVGIGWTLNFGRPGAWLMLLVLLLPLFVVLLLPLLTKGSALH